ncbi:MAG: HAMP domain-containing protein [Betaproteobacteria bacterium]|nr:HAMP domain-containing protein [Betaproteobacteria bacterium]
MYRVYELEPRSRELAQQAVSAVNLTRAALVSADPFRRRQLLIDLNESEGLRVFPSTSSEKLEPLPDDPLLERVAQKIRAALGRETRFALARDGEQGFWVSFFIDVDEYWIMLPRERFQFVLPLQWLGWGAGLLAIALAGAGFIASWLSRPLRALTRAAGRLGRGEAHEPLPEIGARELRALALAFNRMASDLASMERERAMVLAGISHDLRTPLSRLRLALEMSGADDAATQAMIADIDEIDAVIGQFLDYARGENEAKAASDLNALLVDLTGHYARLGRKVSLDDQPIPEFAFARMAVRRAVANLVDNALRYAGEPVEIASWSGKDKVIIEVKDRGPGIPEGEAERLKRPFTRLEAARSGPGGSGLGLAIVERVARGHGGRLDLLPREGGGLLARLSLGL